MDESAKRNSLEDFFQTLRGADLDCYGIGKALRSGRESDREYRPRLVELHRTLGSKIENDRLVMRPEHRPQLDFALAESARKRKLGATIAGLVLNLLVFWGLISVLGPDYHTPLYAAAAVWAAGMLIALYVLGIYMKSRNVQRADEQRVNRSR